MLSAGAADCPTIPAADFSKDAGNGRARSINLVAADVRRLHLKFKKKSEPPHVGCYGWKVAKPDEGMRFGRVRADGEKLFPVARIG
jgi:hypothetical protein